LKSRAGISKIGYLHGEKAMHLSHRHTSSAAWFSLWLVIFFAGVGVSRVGAGSPPAPQSKPPAAPGLTHAASNFEIKVAGSDGKPIPNVQVELFGDQRVEAEQIQRGKLVSRSNSEVTLQADGEGRIALKPQADWKRLALYIEAPGDARHWASWSPSLRSESIPANLNVKLEAGWSVGGTIVDGNGKPIAGATILPPVEFSYSCPEALQWLRDKRIRSDAEGKWHFDSVPLSSDPLTVEINHPNFAPRVVRLKRAEFGVARGNESPRKIILSPGLTLTGQVTDKSGEPIVGAVVLTFYRNSRREAVTDIDGFYRMAGCLPEESMLMAWAKGFAPASQPVSRRPEIAPVNFQLAKGGKLRLRMLDAQGRPIPKAKVMAYPFASFDTNEANQLTDRNGAWELSDAPPSGCVVTVRLPDGSWLAGGRDLGAREQELVLQQRPDLVVSGKVVDAQTKQPIERFRVVPRGRMGGSRWLWSDSFQARGGTYWLRHAGPSGFQVRIEADGYLPAESDPIKQHDGDVTADFALTKGEDIVGNVLTADGKPAASAKVVFLTAGSTFMTQNGDMRDPPTAGRGVVADEAGRFRLPREKSDYWLVITHPSGYAELKCSPKSDPTHVHLTRWARLEGTYLVAGKPQPWTSLSLLHPTGRFDLKVPRIFWSFTEVTDADGRYVFDRLLPGQGTITRPINLSDENGSAGMDSVVSMTFQLESGKTMHFDLGGSGRPVIGQLRWASNAQSPRWDHVVLKVDSPTPGPGGLKSSFSATLDAQGNFSIDAVPPGDYELVAWIINANGIELRHRFSVPAVDKKLSQRPVDLGVLALNGRKAP
jgi:protocatechuate 3,4-dioxygenase beta subunit